MSLLSIILTILFRIKIYFKLSANNRTHSNQSTINQRFVINPFSIILENIGNRNRSSEEARIMLASRDTIRVNGGAKDKAVNSLEVAD